MGALLKRLAPLISLLLLFGSCSMFTAPRTQVIVEGIRWEEESLLRINVWITYDVSTPYAEGLGYAVVHFDVYDTAGHVYRVTDTIAMIEQGGSEPRLFAMDWGGLYTVRAIEPVKAVIYPQVASLAAWEIQFQPMDAGFVADTLDP